LGELQQVLGPRQPLLVDFGEVAAAPANRFGLGDLECGDVLVDGVAVFQLRGPIAEQEGDPGGAGGDVEDALGRGG